MWWLNNSIFTNGKNTLEIADRNGLSLLTEFIQLATFNSSFAAQSRNKTPFDLATFPNSNPSFFYTYIKEKKGSIDRFGFGIRKNEKSDSLLFFDFDWKQYIQLSNRKQGPIDLMRFCDALSLLKFQFSDSIPISVNGFFPIQIQDSPHNEEYLFSIFMDQLLQDQWEEKKINEWNTKSQKQKKEWLQGLSEAEKQYFGISERDVETPIIDGYAYFEIEAYKNWENAKKDWIAKSEEKPLPTAHPDPLGKPIQPTSKVKAEKVKTLQVQQTETLDFELTENRAFMAGRQGLIPFLAQNIQKGSLNVYNSDSLNQTLVMEAFNDRLKIAYQDDFQEQETAQTTHYFNLEKCTKLDLNSMVTFGTNGKKKQYKLSSIHLYIAFDNPENSLGIQHSLGYVAWPELELLLIQEENNGNIASAIREKLIRRDFFPYFRKTKGLVVAE